MFEVDFSKPLLIVGFGNLLLKDDGAGILVIQKLRELKLPENIWVAEGGVMGVDTISILENYSQVILVDCINVSNSDEQTFEFQLDEVVSIKSNDFKFSLHELNLNTVLTVMETLKIRIPKILFLGIKPKNCGFGFEVSENVKSAVDQVVDRILEIMNTKKLILR